MAAGLSTSLERLITIIEGCDSSSPWNRSEQRIYTLQEGDIAYSGLDFKYWIGSGPTREQPEAISGNLMTMRHTVQIELARFWGGGDNINRHYYGLLKALESQANIVEQSILYQPNWAYSSTGIILINLAFPSSIIPPEPSRPLFLWVITLEIFIRQANAAATV